MLRAEPKNVFSRRYLLLDGDVPVGELRMFHFRERAEAVVDNRSLSFFRDGVIGGPFVLESADKRIAQAVKPSVFRSEFEIRFGSVACKLTRKGFFRTVYELHREGSVLGRLERESWWNRNVRAELPEEWPAPLKVFILWLGLIMWRREAGAKSG